jgi:hypothetical protein
MARHVQDYLDTIASRPHATMGSKVRECIYMMLASGLSSAAHVAKRLGTDRRTMHRHLAKEGETFTSLLDSVRWRARNALHRQSRSPADDDGRVARIFCPQRVLAMVPRKVWL